MNQTKVISSRVANNHVHKNVHSNANERVLITSNNNVKTNLYQNLNQNVNKINNNSNLIKNSSRNVEILHNQTQINNIEEKQEIIPLTYREDEIILIKFKCKIYTNNDETMPFPIFIEITNDKTVKDLKQKIYEESGFPTEFQTLYFYGFEAKDFINENETKLGRDYRLFLPKESCYVVIKEGGMRTGAGGRLGGGRNGAGNGRGGRGGRGGGNGRNGVGRGGNGGGGRGGNGGRGNGGGRGRGW